MELSKVYISKVTSVFRENFLFRMLFFLGLLLLVWVIRFPFIFRKIYAEDGSLFLADAIKFKFPADLIEPAAGYSTLIMRLGGRFVSLFPLSEAAVMNAIFTAICLSFLASGLFQYNNFIRQNILIRFTLSASFIFLPLTSFSAVGNIANLYIYFMTASAVFLYYSEKTTGEMLYKCIVLFIAALSLPLTIFLMPIIFHRIYMQKKLMGFWKILKSDVIFVTGIIVQILFILITSLGERAPHSPQSIFKVIYLYVDRGIGISTIPKWGFISSVNGNIYYENSVNFLHSTYIRLALVIVFLSMIAFVFLKNRSTIPRIIRNQVWFLVLLGFTYSILVGLFFNSEPRYMIFTSFLTCWAILLLLESQRNSRLRVSGSLYLIVVLAAGLTASIDRSQGPEWKPELAKAQQICRTSDSIQEIEIRTLPMDAIWKITLPCKKLQ